MSCGRSLAHRLVVFAIAITVVLGAMPNLTRRAAAAPDNTLGMAILSARVSSVGILEFGSGATDATLIAGFAGKYQVDFDRDVSGCVYSVTPFLTGQVLAQPRPDVPNAVFVETSDSAGNVVSRPFYLLVYCHQ